MEPWNPIVVREMSFSDGEAKRSRIGATPVEYAVPEAGHLPELRASAAGRTNARSGSLGVHGGCGASTKERFDGHVVGKDEGRII